MGSNFHTHIYNALYDLVVFVQFKRREKRPQRSVTFSKAAGFWKTPMKEC